MHSHCLRLTPGQDLKQALQAFAQAESLEAGVILTGLGSFTQASLRFTAASDATVIEGPLELISLSGTLSRHGMHLHGAVADAEGRVYGGHIMPGCLIRTTAEIAIANLPHLRLHRQPDPVTGYLELVVDAFPLLFHTVAEVFEAAAGLSPLGHYFDKQLQVDLAHH